MDKFILGGSAGMMATCVIQPVDLIKTRLQLSAKQGGAKMTPFTTAVTVAKKEGVLGLYNGLSAALFRQGTYTTARLGVFSTLMEKMAPADGSAVPLWKKACAGLTAGACGAMVGNPAEVALVRMTSDGQLPAELRRNYKNVFDALTRVVREEGVLTLWRGSFPTVCRAMLLNMGQLTTYAQAKQMFLGSGYFRDNTACHVASASCSGLVASFVSLPADMVKSRMQSMSIVDGVPEFKNDVDCFVKTVRTEGVAALWRGFPVYAVRISGHTILTFLALERLNQMYQSYRKQ